MMRVQEKYPERPAINAKKKWKKLKQREWKGREIVEQNIRDEPSVSDDPNASRHVIINEIHVSTGEGP